MSGPLGSHELMYATSSDFYTHQIKNSCRFDRANASKLSRALGTPTNNKKFTFSTWVKFCSFPAATNDDRQILGGTGSTNSLGLGLTSEVANEPQLLFIDYPSNAGGPNSGGVQTLVYLKKIFRDPSAWYHIVVAMDTTQGTASDRIKFYINGELQTVFDTYSSGGSATPFYPSQNSTTLNDASRTVVLGVDNADNAANTLDGYLAETYFIDGTAYAGSDFGETKNGVWIPKNASGLTFGTNGFYLKYTNSSALGEDFSGNDNDYTVANISAHDQMTDTPTFGSSNGGNFATWNRLNAGSYTTLTEGSLKATGTNSGASNPSGTFAMTSGKWYYEMLVVDEVSDYPYTGLAVVGNVAHNTTTGGDIWAMRYDIGSGAVGANSGANIRGLGTITATSTGVATATDGDIISWYLDCDNRKAWIAKNGTIPNSGNAATGANPQWAWTETPENPITFTAQVYNGDDTILNAGQDGTFAGAKTAQGNADGNGYGNFYYAPPSGFLAMCSGNLPTPSTDPADDNEPTKNHGCLLYTGTGQSSQAQTGLGFLPDFVIIKERGGTAGWKVFDSNRGVTQYLALHNTDAEVDENDSLTAFGADGFTIGDNAGTGANTSTYAAWCWKANGGTTSTNSDGTINCTQQVNANAGFSISTYTGNGQNSTIGHGLSSIPDITMFRERGTAGNWIFRIKGDGDDNNLYPQVNNATSDGNYFQTTAATASVVSIATHADINANTNTYVMWAWENKEGFSQHGLFEGNGNADGSYMHLGFSPAFLMLKSLDSTSGWYVYDNKREGYNEDNDSLEWDVTTAEQTDDQVDLLSNGFKLRTTGDPNVAETFIYMAFAAVPFKYATAR